MKIIEALKKIKDLQRKASDLRNKVQDCSAKMSFESDKYENQKEKVAGWLQSHHDILREIESLREKIAETNLRVMVPIEIGGKEVKKSIHSWISRRRDLAQLDMMAWRMLTDRGLRDQAVRGETTKEVVEFKVVQFFDPEERDRMIDMYKSEVVLIDSKLEVVNAVTDL